MITMIPTLQMRRLLNLHEVKSTGLSSGREGIGAPGLVPGLGLAHLPGPSLC